MPDESGSLLSRTRALLRRDSRSLLDLHKESGLPFYWLKKLSAGEIKDPSVNRIQKLYEFLSKRSLSV